MLLQIYKAVTWQLLVSKVVVTGVETGLLEAWWLPVCRVLVGWHNTTLSRVV